MMDAVLQDLRFAFRLILRAPVLSVATVVTLALGIGLNAGVFTIVNGMLLRPRVTADPSSFVRLQPVYSGPRAPRQDGSRFTTADYLALRDRTTTLRTLAGWTVVHSRFGPESVETLSLLVSCNFFDVYGLDHLERGRTFRTEECEPPARPVTVISDEVWRRHFGADPDVLGKPLLLDRQPFTIVGITPPDFPGRVRGEGIWVPYTNQAALMQGTSFYDDAGTAWLWAEGRLAEDASRAAAEAEVNVVMRQQDELSPGRASAIEVTNGAMIHDPAVAPVAVYIVPLVLGSVGLVLLIACANVALLLLSRAAARRREIAVRLAIGCGRGRLVRMLLTESVVFAALGMPLSAWIAWQVPAALRALIPMMPFYPMQLDARVFVYLATASLIAGIGAGLTPAIESARLRLASTIGAADTLSGGQVSRSRNTLIAAQVAMSLVLLAGTALLLRVEAALRAPDPTVDATHVLVANYDPPPLASASTFAATTARLAALAGVRSVAFARGSNGELGGEGTPMSVRGASGGVRRVAMNVVSPSYFDTLNRSIVQGRALRDEDGRSPITPVVVSETLARLWWPRGGAIGAVLETQDRHSYEVVGVVRGDQPLAGGSFDPMQAYTLAGPNPSRGLLVVRFEGDAQPLRVAVREALRNLGPASSSEPTTLAAANASMAATFMPLVDMVGTVGVTAIVLALVGIYGVVSFSVGRRTREIGVRIALGATRADIMRLVLTTGARPIAAGLACGLTLAVPGAIALSRIFERTPVPLRAGDPLPYIVVAVLLALAALLAMSLPARRAAAVPASVSLRAE